MKNLFRTFVIAVSSIVIISCQKTDINDVNDVSGKWIVVKDMYYDYIPDTKWTFDEEDDSEKGAYYIFNSNGSGKYYNSYSLPDGDDCNWTYSDGILHECMDANHTRHDVYYYNWKIIKRSSKELVLRHEWFDDDGEGYALERFLSR